MIASSRIHGLKRADGECCGDLRSVGYFAQQRRPLGLRGATSDVLDGLYRCRACLSTGQALFYRIGTATASPGSTTPSEQSLGGARIPRPPTPSPPLNPLTGSDPSLTRRNHATNPSTPDLCGITQPLTAAHGRRRERRSCPFAPFYDCHKRGKDYGSAKGANKCFSLSHSNIDLTVFRTTSTLDISMINDATIKAAKTNRRIFGRYLSL